MEAKNVVAIMLALTICVAILSPIVVRFLNKPQGQMPDLVVSGLMDLLKVALGALVGWLAAK